MQHIDMVVDVKWYFSAWGPVEEGRIGFDVLVKPYLPHVHRGICDIAKGVEDQHQLLAFFRAGIVEKRQSTVLRARRQIVSLEYGDGKVDAAAVFERGNLLGLGEDGIQQVG